MKARLLPEWYSDGAELRFYHNYQHASFVAETCKTISESHNLGYRNMHTLWVAGMWHDAVYVPGANDNESNSADALLALLPLEVESASLIRRTRISDHLGSDICFDSEPLLSILLDADLASMAVDSYEDFVYNQVCILKEHGLDLEHINKSANFLKNFLNKANIYRSPYGIHAFEEKARANIKRLIEQHAK
jgi:predicted metal-dependent HD superfamily phosphohydrolase